MYITAKATNQTFSRANFHILSTNMHFNIKLSLPAPSPDLPLGGPVVTHVVPAYGPLA